MALLAQFLLPFCLLQCRLSGRHLLFVHIAEALVVEHVVVGFHHGQADIGLHLLLLGVRNQQPGFGNLVVIHRLEAVEEVIPGTHAVVVVERRCIEIRIGLRVDAAAEVVVRIRLRGNLRRKQLQCRIPAGDAGITHFGLLDSHLGGIGDGVGHAVVQAHGSLAAGAHTHCGRQGDNYTLNQKVFHVNTYV